MTERNSLPPGTTLREYRIERVLSNAGNFSTVYLARDLDEARVQRRRERIAGRLGRWQSRYGPEAARTQIDPGPIVAIKEYAPRNSSRRSGLDVVAAPGQERDFEWGRERFRRESQFLSDHSHPNVVALFDTFSFFGTEYYVMERLTGGSVGDAVRDRGCQNEAMIRSWLMPLLEGLSSVERKGASHLDLSPANVVFRRPGGEPVLVDFGASRLPGAAPNRSSRLVVDDHFAAPEKFKKTSRELDARTDSYSIGAIVNYALTGELPKGGPRRVAGSNEMSQTAAYARAQRASPEFLRVIDRAFSVDPEDRFPDAHSLLEALQGRRTTTLPVVVRPQSSSQILPILLIGGGLALVLLMLAIYMLIE